MKKDSKYNQQKNQIFKALSELILEGGLANVTISNIAKKINKTKNLIFYYFKDKETMLREYVKYFVNDEDVSSIENKELIFEIADNRESLTQYIYKLYYSYLDFGYEWHTIYYELLSLCLTDEMIKDYFCSLQKKAYNDFIHDLSLFQKKGAVHQNIDISKVSIELLVELSGISLTAGTFTMPEGYLSQYVEIRANQMLNKLLIDKNF